MRITADQRAANEACIRAAIDRLLRGDMPPGGRLDVKTLAREAGVDRTAFYGRRPYAHLREEFERRPGRTAFDASEQPDVRRDAQITRLKDEVARLKERLAQSACRHRRTRQPSGTRPWHSSPPSTARSPGCARKPTGQPASAGYLSLPPRGTCPDQRPVPGIRLAAAIRVGAPITPLSSDMTRITYEAGNRHTAHHHQRETSALGSARQNRYTDPLHTASAERRHTFSLGTLEDLVSGYYAQAAKLVADTDNNAALALYLTKADPIQVLRDLLGHSSVLTTQVYLSRIDLNRVFREVYEDAGRRTGLSGAVLAEVDDELADEPAGAL